MTQLVDVSQSLLTQQDYEWSSHGIGVNAVNGSTAWAPIQGQPIYCLCW